MSYRAAWPAFYCGESTVQDIELIRHPNGSTTIRQGANEITIGDEFYVRMLPTLNAIGQEIKREWGE